MKYIQHICAFILILMPLVATAGTSTAISPAMVIRYQMGMPKYEFQLEQVVKSAITIKPEAFFDIVTIVPEFEENKRNAEIEETAEYRTKKLIELIESYGVDEERIRLTTNRSKITKFQEVHLFVR